MTPNLDPEWDVVVKRGSAIPPVPDVVRARSLARARASVAAAAARPEGKPAARRRPWAIAVAASVAVAVVAASAVAGFRYRWAQPEPPAPRPRSVAVERAPAPSAAAPKVAAPPLAPARAPVAKSPRPGHSPSAQESYAAELELLYRAQAAYVGRDFAAALVLVAEHGRRFPNGRLAEEREALRVRSLVSAGRSDEARRAAAAFAERFPRSVHLPRLESESK